MEKFYAGIDVSKSTLDVAINNQKEIKKFNNDEEGINRLVIYLIKASLVFLKMHDCF
jgi:transposase